MHRASGITTTSNYQSYQQGFYCLVLNSWYIQIEFMIGYAHITNSFHNIKNSIRDITNWILEIMKMYMSWSLFGHITNSGLNSKTASRPIRTRWRTATVVCIQGGAEKRGHRPSYLIANIPKTPWPNCMEIGGLCNIIICWTQSLTFCLKISSRCGAT